jgi:hypothetical protein
MFVLLIHTAKETNIIWVVVSTLSSLFLVCSLFIFCNFIIVLLIPVKLPQTEPFVLLFHVICVHEHYYHH